MFYGFDKVLVCTNYNYKGKIIDYLPYDLSESSLKPLTIIQRMVKDLRQIDSFEILPQT